MALNNNFYAEILEKEAYWEDLANKKLLNIYYLNGTNGLKQFYLAKKNKLEYEYNLTHNPIIQNFLTIIDTIINKIDFITLEFRKGNNTNMQVLTKLFLVNQMNNTVEKDNNKDIEKLQIQKQVLENLKNTYISKANKNESIEDDYLYDDFPEQKAV